VLVAFSRDLTTGQLAFIEAQRDGIGGVNDLNGAYSAAVNPDGAHVYAVAELGDAVAVFRRDGATGGLTFLEVHKDGAGAFQSTSTRSSGGCGRVAVDTDT
jgi:6-phosphogluconolactonase (cycloisomerase 2 family)